MSRPLTLVVPQLVTLPADGGYGFKANCYVCEGALIVEGNSRGREDMTRPCMNVSGTARCEDCGEQMRIDVVLTPLGDRGRSPEARWTR